MATLHPFLRCDLANRCYCWCSLSRALCMAQFQKLSFPGVGASVVNGMQEKTTNAPMYATSFQGHRQTWKPSLLVHPSHHCLGSSAGEDGRGLLAACNPLLQDRLLMGTCIQDLAAPQWNCGAQLTCPHHPTTRKASSDDVQALKRARSGLHCVLAISKFLTSLCFTFRQQQSLNHALQL
eukprot:72224-Pelagomonas_calceolata.AAC.2